MEDKKLTDKEMSKKVGTIVDELGSAGKKAIRSIFDVFVEKTAQTASEVFDKYKDKAVDKIDKGASNAKEDKDKK